MPATLLHTKVALPAPRPGLVARPRLSERLDSGLRGRLTLVCAPAGFGKTTLLSAWLSGGDRRAAPGDDRPPPGGDHIARRTRGFRSAWLALDRGDDDPQRFLTYLVTAVRQVDSALGANAQAMLQSAQPPAAEQVLTSLINDLAAWPDRLILVLDDYHVLGNPDVHDLVRFLVDHQPETLHLVIATRADPPLALARLRARGEVDELRVRDLRFTQDEAATFVRETMHLDLSEADLMLLGARTEGWIAGLQLAAHSLRSQENPHAFLAAFAGDDRYVADFLIEEVLASQPAPIHEFLLQTAVLDRLTAPLCDAVTGREDSQAILSGLEQANLFIVPLDNRRQWYRYHQLFADLLRERLGESGLPVDVLHRRASRWYAANSFHEAAIDHALAAGDPNMAIDLIEKSAAAFFASSELTTLARWWPYLPGELAARRPRLCMAYAWAFLATGRPEQAEACIRMIEQAIGRPMAALLDQTTAPDLHDSAAAALAEVMVIRINLAMGQLDLARAAQLAQAVLPHLEIDPEVFHFNRPDDLRTVVMFTTGLAHLYSGQLDAAAVCLRDAWRLAQGQDNVHLVALAVGNLASLQLTRGQYRQAEHTCKTGAHALAEMSWSRSPMTGVVHAHWGSACYIRNDLAAARAHFEEAIRLAEPWGNWEALLPSYLGLARLFRAQEGWPKVFEALDSLERHAIDDMALDLVEALHSLALAELGERDRLHRWLEDHSRMAVAALPVHEDGNIVLARALFVHGDLEAAGELLTVLLADAEAGGRWGRVLEMLVRMALVQIAKGQPALAQASVERALRLAEPEGAVRSFLDAGQALAAPLGQALRSGVCPELARTVLGLLAGQPSSPPASRFPAAHPPEHGADLVLVEPLTDREFEVLALLAQGLSNKAIARALVLTEGTVKTHAHNIYAKLAVNSRGEAVARARLLGFLTDQEGRGGWRAEGGGASR